MRLSIGIQGWLVPEKCILEAFGTGVPARNVTVKWSIFSTDYDSKILV